VSISTTGVTGLATAAVAASIAALVAAKATTEGTSSLGTGTSDVSDLSALVALPATAITAESSSSSPSSRFVGAVTRNMADLSTTVAGFLLLGVGAFAAHMALLTTVVAGSGTPSTSLTLSLRTVTSLVRGLATGVASTATSGISVFHGERITRIGVSLVEMKDEMR